jgi:hypothetical protein
MKSLMTKQLFESFFPANVLVFQSDRSVDFALPQHQHGLTLEQRKALESILNETLPPVFNIQQVHQDRVVFAASVTVDERLGIEEADAVLTDQPNLPIVVRTADCLPVFLYDTKHHAIGLVHGGWRSTQKHILKKTIELMHKFYRTQPAQVKAAFGPALRSCHYEVGHEFLEYFPKQTERRDDKYFFDLIKANRAQLEEAAVPKENIFDCQICSYCDAACFSHRREGKAAGRMLSLMMLRPE